MTGGAWHLGRCRLTMGIPSVFNACFMSLTIAFVVPLGFTTLASTANSAPTAEERDLTYPLHGSHPPPVIDFHSYFDSWDPNEKYWKADWTASGEFQKQQSSGKRCYGYSACRSVMLHLAKAVTKETLLRGIISIGARFNFLLDIVFRLPGDTPRLEPGDTPTWLEPGDTPTGPGLDEVVGIPARVSRTGSEIGGNPSQVDEFYILLPYGTDPHDVEISEDYEITVLPKILPSGLNPEDFELDENEILLPPSRDSPGILENVDGVDTRELPDKLPDTFVVPEGVKLPPPMEELYEEVDDDHPDFEIVK